MHSQATANAVVRTLPPEIRNRWLSKGKIRLLQAGEAIAEAPCASEESAYFPLTMLMAWVNWLCDGSSAAIALIGREGMMELNHVQGLGQQLMVVRAGAVLQVPAHVVHADERQSWIVHQLYRDNQQALMAQANHNAICNQHHGLSQRLARLLQSIFSRLESDSVRITHERLASLLGTRRERVSQAASVLQKLGVISCARGSITVTDKTALSAHGCECCGFTLPPSVLVSRFGQARVHT